MTTIGRRVSVLGFVVASLVWVQHAAAESFVSLPKGDAGKQADAQKRRIAAGVKPRRRMPEMVGMRGSSQPDTSPSSTSCATATNAS